MRAVCLSAVVMLAAACAGDIGPSGVKDFDRTAFTAARARWQAAGISNYTIESRNLCFCPAHLNFWTRITVRGNSVVAAEPVDPLPPNIPAQNLGWQTVPQLFDAIESAGSDDSSTVTKVAVSYDPDFGFPSNVSISCRSNIADCDRGHFLRSLTRLP